MLVLISRSMRRVSRICRRSFLDRNARGCPRARTGRGVVRQQDQENLRAHADPRAAKASQELDRVEEKRRGGKIADAKTIRHPGKISVALFIQEEEKILRESHSRGEGGAGCLRFAEEKEEVFSDALSGFFAESIPKEETQTFPVANSNTRGITSSIFESDRIPGSRRNSQRHSVTFSIRQEKRRTGHHRGQGHIRL